MSEAAAEIARRAMDALAAGDVAVWGALLHEDAAMEFPFAPEGFPPRITGREACIAAVEGLMHAVSEVEWSDVKIFAGPDPTWAFVTASSQGKAPSGALYENSYCIRLDIEGGRIKRHIEYFNPLPVMRVFLQGREQSA